MVGTRRVFFPGTLDYVPDYANHTELNSQRHYKRTISLFERLLAKYGGVVVYGASMTYRFDIDPDLSEVQADVRNWVNRLKMTDTSGSIAGVTAVIEEGAGHKRLHVHALVFVKEKDVKDELMWNMHGLWEGDATHGEGKYCNDNLKSDKIDSEGGIGGLGYIAATDYERIKRTLFKIAYNTKDGYRPEEALNSKRKCFICEEYE